MPCSEGQCETAQKKLEIEINEALEAVDNLMKIGFKALHGADQGHCVPITIKNGRSKTEELHVLQVKSSGHLRDAAAFAALRDFCLLAPGRRCIYGVEKWRAGGLRWSDRFEDYRTEVLGLVKAQQVKNSVIVPVGAKGGFVAKQLPDSSDREAWLAEGIASYKTFIRGLLDVTDNLVVGKVSPSGPGGSPWTKMIIIRLSADKEQQHFLTSPTVSAEYGFWLGMPLHQAAVRGYDHKKMGITAGCVGPVRRHFSELGVNTRRTILP